MKKFLCAAFLALATTLAWGADPGTLRLATTTSTDNSGLLKVIVPQFEAVSGLKVHVISVGTGKAMKLGENGDVDVLLVHSRPDEDRFVAAGFGVERRDVIAAFRRILDARAIFVSRGDDSGTEKMEKSYWQVVGSRPQGAQYLSAGQGMGEVLVMAGNQRGYTLSDRATYGAYRTRVDLEILVEGDARMFNPYGVIAVNPARYRDVNFRGAMQFIEWITGPQGRRAIADFKVNGHQLFFPTPR